MGRYQDRQNAAGDKYNHTPRKVFDKYVDRMDLKLRRQKEDHRSDIGTILRTINKLENQLSLLHEEVIELGSHVDRHCAELDTARVPREDSTEGL